MGSVAFRIGAVVLGTVVCESVCVSLCVVSDEEDEGSSSLMNLSMSGLPEQIRLFLFLFMFGARQSFCLSPFLSVSLSTIAF